MRITTPKSEFKKITIPHGKMANGDWFKCTNPSCEYTVRMLVPGNTATCSQCGSRMVRIS